MREWVRPAIGGAGSSDTMRSVTTTGMTEGALRVASLICLALALPAFAVLSLSARVDVRVQFDKAFDFKAVRTWAWSPGRPGEVMMARTAEDDPEAMRQRAEPIILDEVPVRLKERGLGQADASAADVTVSYYLLLTTSMTSQHLGQFLPANVGWRLPNMPAATTSLDMRDAGALVLDLTANKQVVWRGIAQANIDFGTDPKRREALLRESIRDLTRRFPPR